MKMTATFALLIKNFEAKNYFIEPYILPRQIYEKS